MRDGIAIATGQHYNERMDDHKSVGKGLRHAFRWVITRGQPGDHPHWDQEQLY
ncbi:hypothetical protein A2U01_0067595, partial [Trifolium medium]|nr:hypothetical protein [Trifolium medium]